MHEVSDYVIKSNVEESAQLLITECGCCSCEGMRNETRFDWRSYRTHTGLGLVIKGAKTMR